MTNVVSFPARDIGYNWRDTAPVTGRVVALMDASKLSYDQIAETSNGQVTVGTLKRWSQREVWRPQWVTLSATLRVLAAHGQEAAVVEFLFSEMGVEK